MEQIYIWNDRIKIRKQDGTYDYEIKKEDKEKEKVKVKKK